MKRTYLAIVLIAACFACKSQDTARVEDASAAEAPSSSCSMGADGSGCSMGADGSGCSMGAEGSGCSMGAEGSGCPMDAQGSGEKVCPDTGEVIEN